MKNKKRSMGLVEAGFIVLHIPLLPFDELLKVERRHTRL